MNRVWCLVAAVLTTSLLAASAGDDVRDFVASYTATWNLHDQHQLAGLFAEDADFVMGSAPRSEGRAEIERWWGAYFAHIDPDRKLDLRIDSTKVLAEDVRLLNVHTETGGVSADGTALESRRARGTWVLVRRDGVWRIAAMRGNPAVGEPRTEPGTDR